jgi:Asp-tRNA(Asn)/Glu-tRNA(Gln) amidotransferase A subunit family amidase
MRFAFLGNLTGLPALSVPVGQDALGLPIGLQLMGRPWSEHLLFRAAHAIEQRIARQRAELQFDLLS